MIPGHDDTSDGFPSFDPRMPLPTGENTEELFSEYVKIIIELGRQYYLKDQECRALHWHLGLVQDEKTKLLAKVEEGIRKGWQLEELKQMLYGSKSERFVTYSDDASCRQPSLGEVFDTGNVEAVIAASRARTAERDLTASQPGGPKTNRHCKAHKGREGSSRRSYAVEEVVSEVDYPGDKTNLKKMGKKVVVVYDYVPGKIIKSVTNYIKYIDREGKIYKESVPPRIIEKGRVSNRLVAYMHADKFVYAAPYYRQIRKLQRMGASFAASTVNDWEEICYGKLKRLLKLFKKIINTQDYLQIDEVPISYVNDVAKGKCSHGYFWVVNAPRQKMVLFEFNPSRSSQVPRELLKDFKGKLQCDGLSSYKTAFRDNDEVTLMTCLAHIRRGFFKGRNNNLALAKHFLNETRIIYDIEAYCNHRGISDLERAAIRKKYIQPILEQVQQWMEQSRSDTIPDSPIGKAFTYALNHWGLMSHYLEDGQLLPDNNGAERAIRPVTIYRKNSLFAGNENGAKRAALFFSLLETCKLHNIDPFEYLCDVYDRIHDCPAHGLAELLPQNWKRTLTLIN
jgi:transposase